MAISWFLVVIPFLKSSEQTKAELLISPYAMLLEQAIDNKNDTHAIENILDQLIILKDAISAQPLFLEAKVVQPDGNSISKTNEGPASDFKTSLPLFSTFNFDMVGTVELVYNSYFYHKLEQRALFLFLFANVFIIFLFFVGRKFFARQLKPLENVSNILATFDYSNNNPIPKLPQQTSEEILQVWLSMEVLIQRLRQRETELRAEHQVAENALREKLEAEDASKAKSQFLANMSHELRTPLNAIIGYSEILAEDASDNGFDNYTTDLNKIKSSGRHLLSLINDVLDLSKIESGKMELFIEECDLHSVVRDSITTAQPLIQKNDNTLNVIMPDEAIPIRTDATKLRQNILNLLSNASKFTQEGVITLQVEPYSVERKPWVAIHVEDKGIGMTEAQLDRLFNPFTQADSSTTKKYGGTGLGLTITKRFCELMQGSIEVSSNFGQGTKFVIRIPNNIDESESASTFISGSTYRSSSIISAGAKTSNHPAEERRKKISTILIIDDDRAIHEVASEYLRKLGFIVISAISGRDGINIANQLKPDLILLDVFMSGFDGWEVLAQIRKQKNICEIPVVMMSVSDERANAIEHGIANFIHKPLERNTLTDTICSVLRNRANQSLVILLDANFSRINVFEEIFNNYQWNLQNVTNEESIVQLLENSQPDLILANIDLLDESAKNLLKTLAKQKIWRNIPLVLFSDKTIESESSLRKNKQVIAVFSGNSLEIGSLENLIKQQSA